MCRHIDFIAVLVIAVGMIGFSKASTIVLPVNIAPVQFRKAAIAEPCPVRSEFLARIADILNQ